MTNRTLLIYPGQRGAPVGLVDVLLESHDSYRASVLAEIEARKKSGVPLDDATRWGDVTKAATELNAAAARSDTAAVTAAARTILAAVDGNALTDPGPFKVPPECEGITITMQIVDDATALDWRARRVAATLDRVAAQKARDIVAARAAEARIEAVYDDVVAGVVVAIEGLDGIKATTDGKQDIRATLPGLRLAGLLGWLYSAAQHFLDLPPGKALRCGQPAPST